MYLGSYTAQWVITNQMITSLGRHKPSSLGLLIVFTYTTLEDQGWLAATTANNIMLGLRHQSIPCYRRFEATGEEMLATIGSGLGLDTLACRSQATSLTETLAGRTRQRVKESNRQHMPRRGEQIEEHHPCIL